MSQSVRYHLVEGIRNMWHQLNELARAHTTTGTVSGGKEEENEMIQGNKILYQVQGILFIVLCNR